MLKARFIEERERERERRKKKEERENSLHRCSLSGGSSKSPLR